MKVKAGLKADRLGADTTNSQIQSSYNKSSHSSVML